MWKNFVLICSGILLCSEIVLGDQKNDHEHFCAEGQEPLQMISTELGIDSYHLPPDSFIVDSKKKNIEQPSYEPGAGVLTFWIGVIALFCGYFSPVGILIAGGIFALMGVLLLLFYNKIKKVNPFRVRGKNIVAKIIFALFFFLFLLALIGAIIMAFVVALTLLIAAILSTVINPIVVAAVIMGLGVAWMLIAATLYLIKYRRYKKSLKND